MEFNFGIPSQRGKSSVNAVEFYTAGPALTILQNAGPRTSKNMVLNQQACDLLGLEDGSQIAFDFTKTNPVIVNATGLELPKGTGYVIKDKKDFKGLTFKNSKLWSYFVKTYNLDETADNSFEVTERVSSDPIANTLEQVYLEENSNELILDNLNLESPSNVEEVEYDEEPNNNY